MVFITSMQFVNNDIVRLIQTVGTGAVRDLSSLETTNVRVSRSGNSLDAFMKNTNIRLTAIWLGDYMNFNIFVPRSLCLRSVGHLGNCDGNSGNDIAGPNQCKRWIFCHMYMATCISLPSRIFWTFELCVLLCFKVIVFSDK